jgi:hypothetical protein
MLQLHDECLTSWQACNWAAQALINNAAPGVLHCTYTLITHCTTADGGKESKESNGIRYKHLHAVILLWNFGTKESGVSITCVMCSISVHNT